MVVGINCLIKLYTPDISILFQVKKGVFTIPSFVPEDCRDLVQKMIRVDPEERPTVRFKRSFNI